MYKDATGREIQVGDVVVHFHAASSSMSSSLGVVLERKENGHIKVGRYRRVPEWVPGKGYDYTSMLLRLVPSTIKVSEYCVVVDITPQQLLARYHIGEGETNADGTAAEDNETGRSGLEVSGL